MTTNADVLTYGDLDWVDPDSPYGVYAEGVDLGSAEPLLTALPRLLLDGEEVTGDRSSNRTITLPVVITGADPVEIDDAAAALVQEVQKPRNLLSWRLASMGETRVFQTFRGSLRRRYNTGWDLAETKQSQPFREYELTIAAMPWPRAETAVVETGLTIAATETVAVVDACDALTGWSGRLRTMSIDTATYLTATGSLKSTSESPGAYATTVLGDGSIRCTYQAYFEKTFTPIDTSVTKYLTLATLTYAEQSVLMRVDGVDLTQVGTVREGSWTRYYFHIDADTATDVTIATVGSQVYPAGAALPSTMTQQIDDFKRTNRPPSSSTGRAALYSIPVSGAVRTPGALAIEHETDALGEVMVLTAADLSNGFNPRLRPYRVSGQTENISANRVSGKSEALTTSAGTTFTAEVPVDTLAPGSYSVVALCSRATSGEETLTARAQLAFGSTLVGTAQTVSSVVTFADTDYRLKDCGTLHLPPYATPTGSDAVARITLTKSSATVVNVDDVFLIPLSGAVTRVWCDDGTPAAGASSNRLWIDGPTLDHPYGGVWQGTQADRSDARYCGPDVSALGRHIFTPPHTVVWVMTSKAAAPAVTFTHYPMLAD